MDSAPTGRPHSPAERGLVIVTFKLCFHGGLKFILVLSGCHVHLGHLISPLPSINTALGFPNEPVTCPADKDALRPPSISFPCRWKKNLKLLIISAIDFLH